MKLRLRFRLRLRMLVWLLAVPALLYAAFAAAAFWTMCQPPDRFGRIMAHVPMPALMLVPFETMWNRARGGTLRVGDPAPDFDLETEDRTSRVHLSDYHGKEPVVLVFGSYT